MVGSFGRFKMRYRRDEGIGGGRCGSGSGGREEW